MWCSASASGRWADDPGVGGSYSTGLTSEEIMSMADIAGRDARSKILEISEVNPTYDIDNRTAKLAAQIVIRYLHSPAHQERG